MYVAPYGVDILLQRRRPCHHRQNKAPEAPFQSLFFHKTVVTNPDNRPTNDDIIAYIRQHPDANGRREIAKHFGLKGQDRSWLRAKLKAMADDGLIEQQAKRVSEPSEFPGVMLLDVLAGAETATPAEDEWRDTDTVFTLKNSRMLGSLREGDRVLAQIRRDGDMVTAKPFKRIPKPKTRTIVGRYSRGTLESSNRRDHSAFHVSVEDIGAFNLADGDLVQAETIDEQAFGLTPVRVLRVIATAEEAQAVSSFSLISAAEQNLRLEFPPAVIEEAEQLGAPLEAGRTDLRQVPLVTIDGADARDFDDAIWAEPWLRDDQETLRGYRILVAIADVSQYVAPGSLLDQEAYKRGNSTYFPDRVLPMLPEALSNGWCSLVPDQDRGCLAVDMHIDMEGQLKRYKFVRGIMRSHARLIYEDVEKALLGDIDAVGSSIWETSIQPAYRAYEVLKSARERRGALDIDVPEQVVVLNDDKSRVDSVAPRSRLTAHQLIEEFMVLANVAAATGLEAVNQACMYRLHEEPDPLKLDSLKKLLRGTPAEIPGKQPLEPSSLNHILKKLEGLDYAPMIHEQVLRSQMQAYYGPTNIGHFGLSLAKYAHFTSPIRRYADLCVHRALIAGFKLGEGGEPLGLRGDAKRIGEQISWTERQSVLAERAANDRYLSAYLQDSLGEVVDASVASVTTFGVFFRIDRGHAQAFMPMSLLGEDRYRIDKTGTALIGERWGKVISMGQRAQVKIMDVDPLTGSISVQATDWAEGGGLPYQPVADKYSGPRRGGKHRKPGTTSARARKEAKRKEARRERGNKN